MSMIVPPTIDGAVLAFTASINSNMPVMVPVRPVQGATENNCFPNVSGHVARHGGKLVLGWAIWTNPDIIIEAEHHAVWENDEGDFVDITPKTDKEAAILFLRDDAAAYVGNIARNNIRKALNDDQTVLMMIKAADEFYPYFVLRRRGQHLNGQTARDGQKALDAKNAAITAFKAKFPS